MNQTYMKEKKIFPLVMSMALPMMLSMAFNSLYNIVDSYFVAKLSEDAMTALSLVYPAQNLLTAVAVGFGVGVNAMISFYLGAQNQEKRIRRQPRAWCWVYCTVCCSWSCSSAE